MSGDTYEHVRCVLARKLYPRNESKVRELLARWKRGTALYGYDDPVHCLNTVHAVQKCLTDEEWDAFFAIRCEKARELPGCPSITSTEEDELWWFKWDRGGEPRDLTIDLAKAIERTRGGM